MCIRRYPTYKMLPQFAYSGSFAGCQLNELTSFIVIDYSYHCLVQSVTSPRRLVLIQFTAELTINKAQSQYRLWNLDHNLNLHILLHCLYCVTQNLIAQTILLPSRLEMISHTSIAKLLLHIITHNRWGTLIFVTPNF